MVVSVLVDCRNMLASILNVFRIRSGSKKCICSLSSCGGLHAISLCVWFLVAVIRSGVSFWNHI